MTFNKIKVEDLKERKRRINMRLNINHLTILYEKDQYQKMMKARKGRQVRII